MFRKTIQAGIAVIASLIAPLAAQAADIPSKAPSYSAPSYFGWSGFYVGLNGGYGFGKSSWSNGAVSTGDFDVNGGLAGVTLGYNYQTGSWVWGLEADADASWMKGSTNAAVCAGCETSNTYLATGRGRIGYAWDRWMPYITAGAAYGSIKMSGGGTSDTKSKLGWTAGLGLEYAFWSNWSTKIEYLYTDLGNASCGSTVCAAGVDVGFKANLVRLGVNYRF
jgi:outer membrane immunogenic protein